MAVIISYLCSDLVTALASLHMDDLSHDCSQTVCPNASESDIRVSLRAPRRVVRVHSSVSLSVVRFLRPILYPWRVAPLFIVPLHRLSLTAPFCFFRLWWFLATLSRGLLELTVIFICNFWWNIFKGGMVYNIKCTPWIVFKGALFFFL